MSASKLILTQEVTGLGSAGDTVEVKGGYARNYLLPRGLAIVPGVGVTWIYGERGTAKLLVLSQVLLSMQLPFAVIPLVRFVADKRKMGVLVAPRWLIWLSWVIAALIVALNAKLLGDMLLH